MKTRVITAIVAIFAAVTMLFGWQGAIVNALKQFNLRILSIFCIAIAFSLVWIFIALSIYLWRWLKKMF